MRTLMWKRDDCLFWSCSMTEQSPNYAELDELRQLFVKLDMANRLLEPHSDIAEDQLNRFIQEMDEEYGCAFYGKLHAHDKEMWRKKLQRLQEILSDD